MPGQSCAGLRRLVMYVSLALSIGLLLAGCANRQAAELNRAAPGGPGTASQASAPGDQDRPPLAQLQGIPPLPADRPVPAAQIRARRAAAVSETGLYGDQVYSFSQATAQLDPAGHSCLLDAGAGQLAWAMYAIPELLPADVPLACSLRTLGEAPAGPSYIAFSNYSQGRWDWTALAAGEQEYSIAVGAGADALSPAGTLYLVVATCNGAAVNLGGINVQLDCPAPPPVGFSVEAGDGVNIPVHLSWVDPAQSFDPDGSGPGQFAYTGVLVERALSAGGPWEPAAQLPPGTTAYDDPGSIGGNPPPEGGRYYHLLTLVSGATPVTGYARFGGIDLALIMLKAAFTPAPLSASPGATVAFDATASLISGGTLTSVKWDFDGDGKFDTTSVDTLTTSHTYPAAGRYYPRLMLTMDTGGGSSKTDLVTGYLAVGDRRGDWSQSGRNCQHTSCSPYSGPKTASIRGSYTAASTILGCAIGAEGQVYAATSGGMLEVLNPDCTLDREIDLGAAATGPPALDRDGHLWLHADYGGAQQLICVFPDGSVHASYIPEQLLTQPVVTADGTYVLAGALDTASSKYTVYQATPTPASGDPGWWHARFGLAEYRQFRSLAVARDGMIYVLGYYMGFIKLSPGLALLKADYTTSYDSDSGFAISNTGYLYWGRQSPAWVLDKAGTDGSNPSFDGKFDSPDMARGAPALAADGTVYVSSGWLYHKGNVYAFDGGSGSRIATFVLPDSAASPPVVDAAGRVYVLCVEGTLFCLSRKLALLWSYSLGSAAVESELALGNDGTLYAGGTGRLVAFK